METKVQEIANGVSVEEMKAIFFDADALREPAYKLFQLNGNGHRYYYRFNDDGDPEFYPSVTTLLHQTCPTSPFLIDWMVKEGENAIEKRDLAAAYGTFMHIQFEKVIIERKYDFDAVAGEMLLYMERENLPEKFFNENIQKIRKDVLAFAQFVKDYAVRPMAIEIGLCHPLFGFAGCIDMPCVMTDPKTGEQFSAIVDFKSGRKGFFEEHELQLHLYKLMWEYNFEDCPIERVYNFSPKDWRKTPSYNLKDQTNSKNAEKLPHILALASIEDEKRDNSLTIISGQMSLDDFDPAQNVTRLTLAELVKAKATPEEETPSEEITQESTENVQSNEL